MRYASPFAGISNHSLFFQPRARLTCSPSRRHCKTTVSARAVIHCAGASGSKGWGVNALPLLSLELGSTLLFCKETLSQIMSSQAMYDRINRGNPCSVGVKGAINAKANHTTNTAAAWSVHSSPSSSPSDFASRPMRYLMS